MEITILVIVAVVVGGGIVGGVISFFVIRTLKTNSSGVSDIDAALQSAVAAVRLDAQGERDKAIAAGMDYALSQVKEYTDAARAAESASLKNDLDSRAQAVRRDYDAVTEKLKEVTTMVQGFQKDGSERFGSVTEAIQEQARVAQNLDTTARELNRVLSDNQTRGQWGERMAEDILRLHGFIEGVNYKKQTTTEMGRPDFTFDLPGNTKLYMDVKFPLDNYSQFIAAETDGERAEFKKNFIRDVKTHVRSLAERTYSAGSRDNSIDFVLLFVPNESVYKFIHEADSEVIDEALDKKLVICSPITLYAVLGIVNQATESFKIEKNTQELMVRLGNFKNQWDEFIKKMETTEKQIGTAQESFSKLIGVRQRGLDKTLDKVLELKQGALGDDSTADLELLSAFDDSESE